MTWQETRVDESRRLVREALAMALASYIEQEGKKGDQWRALSIGQHYAHLRHEIDEVRGNVRRGEIGFLLHNAMDVISLGAILLAKALEAAGVGIEPEEAGDGN